MNTVTNTPYTEAPAAPPTPISAHFALILGLCSFVASVLAGIPAIIFGHIALSQIKRSPTPMNGRGFALTGVILGWLSVLLAVALVALVVLGGIAIPAFASSIEQGKLTRARETTVKLEKAIADYYGTYEAMPVDEALLGGQKLLSDHRIMNVLLNEETGTDKLNPEGKVFYVDRKARAGTMNQYIGGLSRSDSGAKLWDPWGKPYRIKINTEQTSSDSIIIWSAGKDGRDLTTDDIKS